MPFFPGDKRLHTLIGSAAATAAVIHFGAISLHVDGPTVLKAVAVIAFVMGAVFATGALMQGRP